MKLGYSPEYGIDLYFLHKAQDKKEIIELESMESQLALFLDAPDGALLLKQTILELSEMEKEMGDIVSSWNKGQAAKLNALLFTKTLREHPEVLPIFERVFFNRNIKMAQRINSFLHTDKTYFVVVGAGHLIGEKGIVALLENATAYRIKQL